MRPLLLLALLAASCKDPPKPAPDAAPPPPPSAPITPVVDAATISPVASYVPVAEGDAGAGGCKLSYGPVEQTFRGPASLDASGPELRLVANDSGKPRVFTVAIPPRGAPPVVPPPPTSFVGMRWPACELAGKFVYCQGPGGAITRSVGAGGDPKLVARSRAGTRIAAAALGDAHSVVAYLDLHRTTEGDMLQAFAVMDDGEPVRISDDGAGATTLRFLQRGDAPVLVYLDTRTAMVPVHARRMSAGPKGLALGDDAVLFVGGVPERGIDLAVATAGEKSFAFVPMARETLDFGMVALVIEDPPKDDIPAAWSRYPNGLDPAPIAAAKTRDGKAAWVARMRPRAAPASSPRILELGRFDGAFTSFGEIASDKHVTDVAIAEDGAGGVWILYGDTSHTWLERRTCS